MDAETRAAPGFALELEADPDAAARLPRLAAIARRRVAATRGERIALTWFDTPEGALADSGRSLCERRRGAETTWLLERARPSEAHPWPPGAPPPLLGQGETLAAIGADLPAPLLPVASFAGRSSLLHLAVDGAPVVLAVLQGVLRAAGGERPVCRVALAGAPAALAVLVDELAAAVPLAPPTGPLAAEAYALAGRPMPEAPEAPSLAPGLTVAQAFGRLAGPLVRALLLAAPRAALGATPEPVHQMRVALRRLRSLVLLFGDTVAHPALGEARGALRDLSRALGPARDLDVFLAGTGAAIAEAFPGERPVARLLAAAERRRRAAYADLRAYLGGPAWRRLALRLACLVALQPWDAPAPGPEPAGEPLLLAFARLALSRRWNKARKLGDDLDALPLPSLHALRIQCKRLRYAAEFFAPLFPGRDSRRFLRRVGALQERLGRLNDAAVADSLMATLGGRGADRAMAAGIVRGYLAAGLHGARAEGERSWRKLRRLGPFWE